MSKIILPSTADSVPTPRDGLGPVAKYKAIREPRNYQAKMNKIASTGRINPEDFDSIEEMGLMIDFHNKNLSENILKEAEKEITEISQFLVGLMNKSTFIIKNK